MDVASPMQSSASSVGPTASPPDIGRVWLLLEFCNKGTVQVMSVYSSSTYSGVRRYLTFTSGRLR